jgi:two-component system, LytTR family, response regulator
LDYLLKPIDEDRFSAALTHAREILTWKKLSAVEQGISGLLALEAERKVGGPAKRFVVRERGSSLFVPVEEIEWIEALGDYVGLHVGGRTHLLRKAIADLEAGLDPRTFVRIHRSAIVRLDFVVALRSRTNRDGSIQLKSGDELKVSRTYSSDLRRALKKQTITDPS